MQARIDEQHKLAYDALYNEQQKKWKANTGMKELVTDSIVSHNLIVASQLDDHERQKTVSNIDQQAVVSLLHVCHL